MPILERQGCQFLWQNKDLLNDSQPFADFEAFLLTLKAKKRKTIRAERRKVAEQAITCQRKCGDAITDEDWNAFYHCYVMTYAVRGQQPYLTIEFFKALAATLPTHLMLAQALDASGEIIASSLFLYDNPTSDSVGDTATLYGRYWGALGEYDSLHFELCYYQGLEFAIEQGLTSFDPGTQGEHKLVRGFIPTITHSIHRIYDPRFVPAIRDFCTKDRLYMAQYRQQAFAALPFNADNMPDFNHNY
jgi:predicted N-acyltransferase